MKPTELFSRVASEYARFRPRYPKALFAYLANESPARTMAWDCGTGNGQAAFDLVDHFASVYATDASSEQLAHAPAHERIRYAHESAESVSLEAGTVDLVTVAIAVHWFDLECFYAEVRRVLRPGGLLAVWTYHLPRIDPAVDEVLRYYYEEIVSSYWPEGFHFVRDRYRTLPFPFEELAPPTFEFESQWRLEQIAGFLASWSATRSCLEQNAKHPLEQIWERLRTAWGDPVSQRRVQWPLHLRVGRWSGAD